MIAVICVSSYELNGHIDVANTLTFVKRAAEHDGGFYLVQVLWICVE